MTDAAAHYLEEARRQLRGHKRMGEGAMTQLRDQDFFVTLDPEANSMAILVKHITGNMRSRFTDFLTCDGEKPDRFRDREFELVRATTRAEVMSWWEEGWRCVFDAIDRLKPEDVMRRSRSETSPIRFYKRSIARSGITRSTSARSCSSPSICDRANGRP